MGVTFVIFSYFFVFPDLRGFCILHQFREIATLPPLLSSAESLPWVSHIPFPLVNGSGFAPLARSVLVFSRAGTTPILEKMTPRMQWKTKIFHAGSINSGHCSGSCSENCGFRIAQVVGFGCCQRTTARKTLATFHGMGSWRGVDQELTNF